MFFVFVHDSNCKVCSVDFFLMLYTNLHYNHYYKTSNHNSVKSTKSVLTQVYVNKTYIHKHQTKHFKEFVPSVLLSKKHAKLGHTGSVDHSVDLSCPDFKKKHKTEWTEAIKNNNNINAQQ